MIGHHKQALSGNEQHLLGYTYVVGLLRRRAARIGDAARPATGIETIQPNSSGWIGRAPEHLSPMPSERGSDNNNP
jgi:hypothetical protein